MEKRTFQPIEGTILKLTKFGRKEYNLKSNIKFKIRVIKNGIVGVECLTQSIDGWHDLDGLTDYNRGYNFVLDTTHPESIYKYFQMLEMEKHVITKGEFKGTSLKGLSCVVLSSFKDRLVVELEKNIGGNGADGLGKAGHCITVARTSVIPIKDWYSKGKKVSKKSSETTDNKPSYEDGIARIKESLSKMEDEGITLSETKKGVTDGDFLELESVPTIELPPKDTINHHREKTTRKKTSPYEYGSWITGEVKKTAKPVTTTIEIDERYKELEPNQSYSRMEAQNHEKRTEELVLSHEETDEVISEIFKSARETKKKF